MFGIPLLLAILAISPADLEKNPGVEKVEIVVPGDNSIIHILDYHIVDKELLGKNLEVEGEKLDAEHAQVVKDASAVHESKKLILDGIEEVFVEGLMQKDKFIFDAEIKALKKYHTDIKVLSPDDGVDAKELIDQHAQRLLRLGTPGEMLLDGKKINVIPAESKEYDDARPKDGKIDDKTNLAREEAIVRKIIQHGKTSVLILGGAHDLSEIVKKHKG